MLRPASPQDCRKPEKEFREFLEILPYKCLPNRKDLKSHTELRTPRVALIDTYYQLDLRINPNVSTYSLPLSLTLS